MKNICVISFRYPTDATPINHVFVKQLVWELADMGVNCTVISPVSILDGNKRNIPRHIVEETSKGNKISLYFPRYISLGSKKILNFNTLRITASFYYKSICRIIEKNPLKIDAVYGHFIVPSGIAAARIGRKFNIPSYFAFGESSPSSLFEYGIDKIKLELNNISGVVSVSSANKELLIKLGLISEDKIIVYPNAVRNDIFYQRDKIESRKKLGLPEKGFIVAFVGQFIERKGVLRVAEALEGLDDVYVVYAGKGEQTPTNSNCIHAKPVEPKDMPYFLSAADVFVLPTLNEGCCNAIVEAIACGLPIISSDRPFNHDILDNDNAILVDPMNIAEIRNAVLLLKNDLGLVERMRKASLDNARRLSLTERASGILKWIGKDQN